MLFHQQERESLPTMPGMQREINHRIWGFSRFPLEKYRNGPLKKTLKTGVGKTWDLQHLGDLKFGFSIFGAWTCHAVFFGEFFCEVFWENGGKNTRFLGVAGMKPMAAQACWPKQGTNLVHPRTPWSLTALTHHWGPRFPPGDTPKGARSKLRAGRFRTAPDGAADWRRLTKNLAMGDEKTSKKWASDICLGYFWWDMQPLTNWIWYLRLCPRISRIRYTSTIYTVSKSSSNRENDDSLVDLGAPHLQTIPLGTNDHWESPA